MSDEFEIRADGRVAQALTEAGVLPGAAMNETRPDTLTLLAEISKDLCQVILSTYESTAYAEEMPEWERMRLIQKELMLAGRHVPSEVDQVVDHARAHGGLKR